MSPDKLVDENDPSTWVAKTKVAPVKFTKWFLLICILLIYFLFLQHEYCLFSFISTVWNWGLMAKEGDTILQTVKFYKDMQWLKFIFETVVLELL